MKKVKTMSGNEIETVSLMIKLYCNKNHGTGSQLCPECEELLSYSVERSQKCPFKENKTFCSNCRVHCYKSVMRSKIKQVMRFSGPRMIFYHPVMAVKHLVETKKERARLEKFNES